LVFDQKGGWFSGGSVEKLKSSVDTKLVIELIILLAVISLAAFLRFYKLGQWGFWGDEAFTLSGREDGFNYSIFRRSLATDLIRFSVGYLGVSEWSARLVPALIGVLTIPLTYIPVRRLFGVATALIAAAMLALSTWHLYWSQNARFYSLLLLFYTLALLVFYIGFEEDRPWLILGSLALFGLAARERLLALFFLPVVAAYLALVWLLPFEKPKGLNRRNLLIFFGPTALVGAVFAFPYLADLSGWMTGFSRVNNNPFWLSAGVAYYVGLAVIVTAAFTALYLLSMKNRAGLFFGLSAVIPLAALLVLSFFHYTANRYVFITLTSWIILAGLGINEVFVDLSGRQRLFAAALLTIILLSSLGDDLLYYRYQNGNRDDWKSALEYVQAHRVENDIVVSTNTILNDLYLEERGVPLIRWKPDDFQGPGRVWIIEDITAQALAPQKINWIKQNAQEMANFDVHVQARNFTMRIYLYDPVINR
jgi:mannosyltransferase